MKKIFLFLSVILLTSLKAMAAEPYALLSDNNTKLTFYYGTKPADGMSVGPFDFTHDSPSGCEWVRKWETITIVVFDSSMDNCHSITSTAGWFFSMAYLTTITNLQYLHTENVTDMQYMFEACRVLESIDLSNFNTEKVTNMKCMFRDCQNLKSLDLSKFNTSNVTNMEQMFGHCPSLTSINLSSFNTANVTNMNNMFYHCSSLTSLDLSGFNTGKVTDMSSMFLECASLTSLDVSGFNTGSVTNMNGMFADCSSLKTIYCYDTWNPSSSRGMFIGCTSLIGGDGTLYSADNVTAEYAHPNDGGYFSKKTYALLSNSNKTLTFYYGIKPDDGMSVGPFTGDSGRGWHSAASTITSVVFAASMANCNNITSTAYWFYGLDKLTTITGIDNLNTENVTDMYEMFDGCSSLTSLDVSKFDTGKVTDMGGMFRFCFSLISLDLSGFKTGSVTNMLNMFNGCSSLTSLDVSKFDTSKVKNMGYMFNGCSSLTSLDVSRFNTSNVEDMDGMFHGCSSLTSLNVSKFDTSKVTNMANMFTVCSNLPSLDLIGFNTGNVKHMDYMFYGCSKLKTIYSYDTWNSTTPSQNMFTGCTSLVGGTGTRYSSSNVTAAYAHPNEGGYFSKKLEPYALLSENNTKLTFYYGVKPADGMDVIPFGSITDRGWNSAATTITTVEFDASMDNCNTVTSTAYWFYGLDKLTTITGIDNLNTANVIDMSFMFRNCSSLTSLVLSGLDTDNVTDMMCMFAKCSSLTSLDVSGFDTGSVKSMSGMFSGCSALTILDVSGFDTGSVTDMSGMFADCSSLTSLDLSGFNTGSVKYMGNMFIGCSSLTSLDLSGFDTGNVTDMPAMFYGCSSLTSLDVSRFNTGKVTDMGSMFRDCSSLKTIYCYDTWTPTTSSSYMFTGCTSLVGGDGTHYSADNVTAAYAHPYAGGYFSKKTYALLSDNNTKLTFYYGVKPDDGIDVKPFVNNTDPGWYAFRRDITTVKFDYSMENCGNTISTAFWFYDFQNLTTFNGLDRLNTANVEDMQFMFYGFCSMPNLDLRSFDTRNVQNFRGLFKGSSGIQSLDLSSFDTGNATNMEGMFQGCSGLISLNLMNFNTENVTTMMYMFNNCTSLQTIYCYDTWNPNTSSRGMFSGCTSLVGGDGTHYSADHVTAAYAHPNEGGYFTKKPLPYAVLSDNNTKLTFYYDKEIKSRNGMDVGPFTNNSGRGWNSAATTITTVEFDASMGSYNNITSTAYWFRGFSNLTTITGLGNLKTTNVEDMSGMFAGCEKLNSLDLRTFDTQNVKTFEDFLYECSGLQSIDLSSFDTSNALKMSGMFSKCHNLTTLDLRGFNTSSVYTMIEMFYACFNLTTIFCNDYWNQSTSSKDMFQSCPKLKGGTGFSWDVSRVDAKYANPGNQGYFTKKRIILGDVNDDGKVTPADAIMILYHYFNVAQNGFHLLAADVNGDKKISPADAIGALYIYFGSSSGGNARATQPMTGSSRDPE